MGKVISWLIPFSFKSIPRNPKDYVYGNKVTGLTLYLTLENKLENAVKMAKNVANKTLRNFADAFYVGLKLYSMFYPHRLMQKVIQNSGAKHTLVFTNVAGFIKPVLYNGKWLKEMYYLPTA